MRSVSPRGATALRLGRAADGGAKLDFSEARWDVSIRDGIDVGGADDVKVMVVTFSARLLYTPCVLIQCCTVRSRIEKTFPIHEE